jgi:hypothetical protein
MADQRSLPGTDRTFSVHTFLGPTEPPIQRGMGSLPPRIKQPDCEVNHSQLAPSLRMSGAPLPLSFVTWTGTILTLFLLCVFTNFCAPVGTLFYLTFVQTCLLKL